MRGSAKMARYKRASERYYNAKVITRHFAIGDLVLRNLMAHPEDQREGVLGPNWEGPYHIQKRVQKATYNIVKLDGTPIKYP